jgi:3-methylfumaryl-CoA hydratase
MDIAHLQDWVGKSETAQDTASDASVAGLAALLDHDMPPWTKGEAPPLTHWLWFHSCVRESALGPDGHAKCGGFLPPVDLPRRMWAGSRVQFLNSIALGSAIRRVSTIANIEAKEGKSGQMVFVTVAHEIFADDTLAVSEEQDIVYREAPSGPVTPPAPPKKDRRHSECTRAIAPDPVLLFRYSALTFNAHRIHYDRDYAHDIEGYPGLVVHGPLVATLLMDHYLRAHPCAPVTAFRFRAQRPLFDTAPFDLCMTEAEAGADLWALNAQGETAFAASIAAR